MPLYEYACRSCGAGFERRAKFQDREVETACPRCGGRAALLLSAPAMVGGSRSGDAPRCDTGPGGGCGGVCAPS